MVGQHDKGFILEFDEVDILRDKNNHDLLDPDRQLFYLARVEKGYYDLVIVSPPCNTHSRLLYSNNNGPCPVRSWEHPLGFPWLAGHNAKRCRIGTEL
eukprot:7409713-Heterocapsa_arctica.AAC.1